MPTYDNPQRERYSIAAFAFGGATANRQFQGPPGKKGLVRDILAAITTAMVGTTTVPEIRVGSAASDSSFARFRLGTTLTAGYAAGEQRARSLCVAAQGNTGGKPAQLSDFASHVFLEGNNGANAEATPGTSLTYTFIPADTLFFVTGVAGTVGAPAGTADVAVDVDWF